MESVTFEQTRAELPNNEGCSSEEESKLDSMNYSVLRFVLIQASSDVYEAALDKVIANLFVDRLVQKKVLFFLSTTQASLGQTFSEPNDLFAEPCTPKQFYRHVVVTIQSNPLNGSMLGLTKI